jgi:hypothetical protein
MPRLLERNPSYRKHKATGQAVVTLSGRDFYLGPWQSAESKHEYTRLVREWNAAGGVIPGSGGDSLTIVELLKAFWHHAKLHYGEESSETQNYSSLIKRVRKAYGKTLVREFGPLRLKGFRQSLVDEKLSRTTINHAINRLRRIFKWGVENELVRPEVLAALKCVVGLRFGKSGAKETEPIKPVAEWVVEATLPYCSPQVGDDRTSTLPHTELHHLAL